MSVTVPSNEFINTGRSYARGTMLRIPRDGTKLIIRHTNNVALYASYMIRLISSATAEPSYLLALADAVDFV